MAIDMGVEHTPNRINEAAALVQSFLGHEEQLLVRQAESFTLRISLLTLLPLRLTALTNWTHMQTHALRDVTGG